MSKEQNERSRTWQELQVPICRNTWKPNAHRTKPRPRARRRTFDTCWAEPAWPSCCLWNRRTSALTSPGMQTFHFLTAQDRATISNTLVVIMSKGCLQVQLQPTVLETRRELFSRLTSRWEVAVSRSLNWEPALKRPTLPCPGHLHKYKRLTQTLKYKNPKTTSTWYWLKQIKDLLVVCLPNAHCELKSGHKHNKRCYTRANLVNWTVTTLERLSNKITKTKRVFSRSRRSWWPSVAVTAGPWSNLVCPGSRAVQRRGPSVSRQWEPAERNRTNTISCVEKYGLMPQQIYVNWLAWKVWACE